MICSPSTLRDELVAWQEDLAKETAEKGPVLLYRWGGFEAPADGHDCSGHIVWACRQVGIDLPRGRAWADSLWRDLEPTSEPLPGDLVIYGRPLRATHVMMVLGPGAIPGNYRVGGMTGGGSSTTTPTAALAQGAHHRVIETHRYRRDFLAFRRLPVAVSQPKSGALSEAEVLSSYLASPYDGDE